MTIFSDILIDGNTISYGASTLDGVTDAYYSYQNCIYTAADAIITDNLISGIGSSSSNPILYLDNGTGGSASCFISNNKLIRGVSTVQAYVFVNSSADQTIINNYFDGYTVDGVSNENLVVGLTVTSAYKENKNQTGYMAIPKLPYITSRSITDPPADPSREYARYADDFHFSNNTSVTTGPKEGFSMNYIYAFVTYGNFSTGTGPFSVQNGSDTVTCNISTTGDVSTLVGMRIRFNQDDIFYVITTVTPSSGTSLTSFTITSATDFSYSAATSPAVNFTVPSFYQGLQSTTAIGRIYNVVPSSGKALTNVNAITTPTATFNFDIDVNELLPTNVQVLTFIVGVNASSTTAINSANFISSAYASTPATFNLTSLTGSMADVKNYSGEMASTTVAGGFSVPSQVSIANLVASSQYVINDISTQPSSVSQYFITGKGNVIRYTYCAQMIINVADQTGGSFPGSSVYVLESPVMVKYRWI